MKTTAPFLMTLLSSSLLVVAGCSSATFHGKGSSKASSTPPSSDGGGNEGTSDSDQPTGDDGKESTKPESSKNVLSCVVSPASIKLGRTVAITIKSTLAEGLLQTVVGAGTSTDSKLLKTADGYTLESGEANNFNPTKEGQYTVELRRGKTAAPDATCQFTVTPKTVVPPVCTDGQTLLGVHMAFLIDNSGSNSATDCPNRIRIGNEHGVDTFQCQGSTNREKAVLTAYDILSSVAQKSGQESAKSTMAIASFPTNIGDDGFKIGSKEQTNGFLSVSAEGRPEIANAMTFSRLPSGLTPYGAAFDAGSHLFSTISNDGKARVAVLVTDGEPTDQNPNGVAAKAKALRDSGVEVITVFITGKSTRANREGEHRALLNSIDASSIHYGNGHWYSSVYDSIDSYAGAIFGLPVAVAGTNKVVEVQDASALESVFMEIIESKAIKCN